MYSDCEEDIFGEGNWEGQKKKMGIIEMGSKKRENDDYKRRRTKKIGENDKRDWEKAGERDKF